MGAAPGVDARQNIFENFPTPAALIVMEHISDHDLERYHLGMVIDEPELAQVEEHLLGCAECALPGGTERRMRGHATGSNHRRGL
jgi:hypothetical protein